MTSFVLDANVAAAWYLPESFSLAARGWRDRLLDGRVRLVVPSLHFWEIANVLRTYVRRGELAPALAEEIYSLHLEAPLEVREPDRREVLAVTLEFEATAYDAVYIALGRSLGIPLLTGERPTTPWVVQLGDQVRTLRQG